MQFDESAGSAAESQRLDVWARRGSIAAVIIFLGFLAFQYLEDTLWARLGLEQSLRFAINICIIVAVFGGLVALMKKAANWEARAKLIRCGMPPEEARMSLRGLHGKMIREMVQQAIHDYALLHPAEVDAWRVEIKQELLKKYRVTDEQANTVLTDGPALLKQKVDGMPAAAAADVAYAALRRRDREGHPGA